MLLKRKQIFNKPSELSYANDMQIMGAPCNRARTLLASKGKELDEPKRRRRSKKPKKNTHKKADTNEKELALLAGGLAAGF